MKIVLYLLFISLFAFAVLANSPPTIPTLITPTGGETFEENATIEWVPSTDPDSDFITYTIEYSNNSGSTWGPLASNLGHINRFSDGTKSKDFFFIAPDLSTKQTFLIHQRAQFNLAVFNLSGDTIFNSNVSQIQVDIGDDGTVDYFYDGNLTPDDNPIIVDITSPLQKFVDSCRRNFLGFCPVDIRITSATTGILTWKANNFRYNLSAYDWITNYLPNNSSYRVRIKATDGTNASAYDEVKSDITITNTNECGSIWTDKCQITKDTTLIYGTHFIPSGVDVLFDNITIDSDGAELKGNDQSSGIRIGGLNGTTIRHLNLTGYTHGISTCDSSGSVCRSIKYTLIENNTIHDNRFGIFMQLQKTGYDQEYDGSNNISFNHLKYNSDKNIQMKFSRYTLVEDNLFESQGSAIALFAENAGDAIIYRNTFKAPNPKSNDATAIHILGNPTGMDTNNNNNVILNNSIVGFDKGIYLLRSDQDIVTGNIVQSNENGIWFDDTSKNNYAYVNFIDDNTIQAIDDQNNSFDFIKLIQGNQWSNFDNSSEGCNDSNDDKRCDANLTIDSNSVDHYPLTKESDIGFGPQSDDEPPPIFSEAPPILLPFNDAVVVTEGDEAVVNATAFGIGLDLNYTINDPRFFVKNATFDNVFTWDTQRGEYGTYTFVVTVTDGEVKKTQPVTVTITENNSAPYFTTKPPRIAYFNQLYTYDANATDAENDLIVYSLKKSPKGMTINDTTGLVQWLPRTTGIFNVTIRATDTRGLFDSQRYKLSVCSSGNLTPATLSNPPPC